MTRLSLLASGLVVACLFLSNPINAASTTDDDLTTTTGKKSTEKSTKEKHLRLGRQKFTNPKLKNKKTDVKLPVDFCASCDAEKGKCKAFTDTESCGKLAADAFCQAKKGAASRAMAFSPETNTFTVDGPTWVTISKATNELGTAATFEWIECA